MLRRRLLPFLPLLLLAIATPAAASEKKKEEESKQVGQYVDLQPVALPIVVDGQLVNYIFVSVRLNLMANADTSRWRAREPYFRDALVRAGHQTPFTLVTNYAQIDAPRLRATLMRAATAITGPNVIRSVVITSQVSSRRVRTPAT
jgi:putative intracellular protease/amidase